MRRDDLLALLTAFGLVIVPALALIAVVVVVGR